MNGFVHDAEAGRLHHQPCGKTARVWSRDDRAAARDLEAAHVCEGHGWTGPTKLVYRSPGKLGLSGPAPS